MYIPTILPQYHVTSYLCTQPDLYLIPPYMEEKSEVREQRQCGGGVEVGQCGGGVEVDQCGGGVEVGQCGGVEVDQCGGGVEVGQCGGGVEVDQCGGGVEVGQCGGGVEVDQCGGGVDAAVAVLQRAFRVYQRRKMFRTQLMRHRAAKRIQAAW